MSFVTSGLIIFICAIFLFKIFKLLLNHWKWIQFFRKLPGPNSSMKNTGDLSEEAMISGGYFKQFPRLHTMWRGPIPYVSVHHPDTMKPILQHVGLKKSGRLSAYGRLKIMHNGLTVSDDDKVPEKRQIFEKFLNAEKRSQYQTDVRDATNKTIDKIEKTMKSKQSLDLDIYPVINRLMLNIHLTSFFSYNDRSRKFDINKFLQLETKTMNLFYYRHSKWYLYVDWLYYLTPLGIIDKILLGNLKSLVKKFITPKEQKIKIFGFKDLMDRFMSYREDIRVDSAIELLMSRKGVVSAISWTLYYLTKFPEYQSTIREERRGLFDEQRNLRTDITESDFQRPKVTNLFIKEVLRICPAVPSTERQIATDLVIDGIKFPAGSNFYFNIYALHHNAELWDKPEEFIPERFETVKSTKESVKYSPFLTYSRSCVAKRYSIECILVIAASLLQRYEVILNDTFPVEKMLQLHQLQIPASGLNVILKKI